MVENVIVDYNQSQIDDVICELNGLYTDLSGVLAKQWLYSVPCIDMCLYREVFLLRWAIDGQLDTNLLSTEELNYIVDRINNITCGCSC
jgi:hypothetical protein